MINPSQRASEDFADFTEDPWEVPSHSAGDTVLLASAWSLFLLPGFPKEFPVSLPHACKAASLSPEAFLLAADIEPCKHVCACFAGVCVCA